MLRVRYWPVKEWGGGRGIERRGVGGWLEMSSVTTTTSATATTTTTITGTLVLVLLLLLPL